MKNQYVYGIFFVNIHFFLCLLLIPFYHLLQREYFAYRKTIYRVNTRTAETRIREIQRSKEEIKNSMENWT